ncbi:MAG: ABC transporter substrate-binding protein [Clostridium argentinense]|uniref:ABC transporter substrate-binding protein n=1 Tax=Clostridium faecium TaxID=2762223 RepID=A0ABR8YPY0_9CLOT|nr:MULTISPECIES: ABC transporter substrate-binding protein [Clostridium]MBD8046073.1 ABC transporter substrate-binding protein [Clostridium faecium]MBS5822959.1 ABC transporter substrate-binding protein [Clostridium argentinense]MDU1349749.1 ABC transporter substrate-binding protein [Clostridium argentinense]
MNLKLKRKNSSHILSIMLIAAMITIFTGCSNDASKIDKAELTIDSSDTKNTVSTKIEDEKVYVSLKEAFEFLGGQCIIEGNNANVTKGEDVIKVDSTSKDAYVNSKKVTMSDMPKVIDKDIYVPIDFLNESMDARVTFDKENKALNIRTEMPLLYTKSFSVKYLKGGLKKVVDGDKRTFILVPEGKDVPEEYKNEMVVKTPIKNVLTASTTQACLLRPIDELSSIIGVTTDADQWQIEEVKKNIESGKTTFVGKGSAPDYEKISSLKPEIVFVYSGPAGQQAMMEKLDELKINYAVDNEYLEESPFGRVEWMKFLAAFYDKEEAAEKYFNKAIETVKEEAKKIENKDKPKISWGFISKGEVYVPKSGSYVAEMIKIAGGEYIFDDLGTGNGKISIEEFYAKSKDADILIYSSTSQWSPTLKSVLDQAPTLEKINPVKNNNVWCFHPDYWQSTDKVDELIIDLINIFHNQKDNKEIKHYIKY